MIVVLTYDHPHRKTEDVVAELTRAGLGPVELVALPWVERKQHRHIYPHRPAESTWPCQPRGGFNLPIEQSSLDDLGECLGVMSPSWVVVGGAGILPKEVVESHYVLNVHPGLLPARRGYDVLKWAIHDMKPVGVTAHIVDARTDLGSLILSETVPVYPEDTFTSFAMRQYEAEIAMIPKAIRKVDEGFKPTPIEPGETKPFKRMPVFIETRLLDDFEAYKRIYASA